MHKSKTLVLIAVAAMAVFYSSRLLLQSMWPAPPIVSVVDPTAELVAIPAAKQ